MRKNALSAAWILTSLLLAAASCPADIVKLDTGLYFDLPEGYAMSASGGNGVFQFVDSTQEASLDIIAYEGGRYASAAAILEGASKKLAALADGAAFLFQGRGAWYGKIAFRRDDAVEQGYAFCMDGLPGERDLLLLSYADSSVAGDYQDFLVSAIDSFAPDLAGLRLPGPASWSAFPPDRKKDASSAIGFGGAKLSFPSAPGEPAALQVFIEREARVLSAYGDEPRMWPKAWKRYYRRVFRDSYHRLDALAFVLGIEIEKRLSADPLSPAASPKATPGAKSAVPKATPAPKAAPSKKATDPAPDSSFGDRPSDRQYVESVLSWVQGFIYTRMGTEADLMNPLDCATKADGDCDARALLMAILLQHWNLDAGMAVSYAYSHALALVDLPGSQGYNAGLEVEGKRYLVAETTAKVEPGLIAQDQSDPEKWIGIRFDY